MKTKTNLQELNEDNFGELLTIISQEDAEKLYGAPELHAGYDDNEEISPVGLYKGNLHVSSISAGDKSDTTLYKLIVDGDLTVDGNIDWYNELNDSYVVVTGNLKAKSMVLGGTVEFYVKGNVEAECGIMGHTGDDGGSLTIGGTTKAPVIVNTTYFSMSFGHQPNAIVIGDTFRTGCAVDYSDEFEYDEDNAEAEPLLQILLPKYWDEDGTLDSDKIGDALRAGKSILKKQKGEKSKTADKRLLQAVDKNDVEAVKKLITEGSDLNPKNYYGSTPLAQACLKNQQEIAMLLIDAGAAILLTDKYKQYPMQLAAENGGHDVVQRLLAMGSPINAQTTDNSTALQWAAEKGHLEIVKTLIEAGADPALKNNWSKGPLELAKENKHTEIVDYLKNLKKK
ncbi:MAG: ankyrin repeat domain-containing protein [Tannerella sp.]|jgi:hypothetical protein|nr:ankyrin repeat domain-containing protein [Tannerella sp.]